MTKYKKCSRWIKIRYIYITSRHSLADYAEPNDIDNKLTLCCFYHNGKLYAIDQFMSLSYPIMFDDKDGKLTVVGYYDSTNWYNPLLLEIHPDGEYIRLWEEMEE